MPTPPTNPPNYDSDSDSDCDDSADLELNQLLDHINKECNKIFATQKREQLALDIMLVIVGYNLL